MSPHENPAPGLRKAVYELVGQIPEGKVTTYGTLARLAGFPRSAREVGIAMSCAPDTPQLPCHRVVNRLGEMAPDYVFGSRELQRDILESEGIGFLPNGRIDMARHLWEGPGNSSGGSSHSGKQQNTRP